MSNKIALIDYDAGNLFSVERALRAVKADYQLTDKPSDVSKADKIIIPGVGAFAVGMQNLAKRGLILPIKEAVEKGKPILGICLGMQLLMDYSEEFGKHQGLGLLKGGVNKIKTKAKLPQIGWNTVKIIKTNQLTNNIKNNDWFYFVHSYVIRPKNNKQVFGITEYGKDEFCSIISYNQVYGVQFHPEKSGPSGLKIYHNFVGNVRPAASS
jgi:glutamine amidotransferase